MCYIECQISVSSIHTSWKRISAAKLRYSYTKIKVCDSCIMEYCLFLKLYLKILMFSYPLSHEYWMAGNRYSWLLFTSEDHICTNLCMQKQLMNMTSECQHQAFTWCHILNCGDVTMPSQKRLSLSKVLKLTINDCSSWFVCLSRA